MTQDLSIAAISSSGYDKLPRGSRENRRSRTTGHIRKASISSVSTEATEDSSGYFTAEPTVRTASKVRFLPVSCRDKVHKTLHRHDMTPEEQNAYWWNAVDENALRIAARQAAASFTNDDFNKSYYIAQLDEQYDEFKALIKEHGKAASRLLTKPSRYSDDNLNEWAAECEEFRGLERSCSAYFKQMSQFGIIRYRRRILALQHDGRDEEKIGRQARAASLHSRVWARALAEADALAAQCV